MVTRGHVRVKQRGMQKRALLRPIPTPLCIQLFVPSARTRPRISRAHFVGEDPFFLPHVRAQTRLRSFFRKAAIFAAHPDGPPFLSRNFLNPLPPAFFLIAYCRACAHSLFSCCSRRLWPGDVASITIRIGSVPALTFRSHNFSTC
jgi:hypothetical protein